MPETKHGLGRVSIITVNFNQTELTCALLESIRRQDYRDVETIVVDNASQDDPRQVFLTRFPEIKYIHSAKNLGFAGGNNLALSEATGEFLFFVNNDAEIEPGCIARLVELLQNTPNAGIVSPLICYHPASAGSAGQPTVIQYAGMPRVNPITGRSRMAGAGEKNQGQYPEPFATGYAHGAAMMVPKSALKAVGPMREDYFLYYEEIDWCERMHQAGYGVWVEPRALVWHKESMTMSTLGNSKTYYMTRNRILFMRWHYGGWRFVLFSIFHTFATVPAQLFRFLRKREWANLAAFLKALFLM